MSFLKTNYRLRGGLVPPIGSYNSVLLVLSLADCAGTFSVPGDGPITCSTGGYGTVKWAGVVAVSTVTYSASLPVHYKVSQAYSGSIFWLQVRMSDSQFSNTVNAQFLILIASR